MFNGISVDDLPDDLQKKMEAVSLELEIATKRSMAVFVEISKHIEQKAASDDGISEHELRNAINPVMALASGYRPVVIPFEIRGGEDDGKRLITLCVMLADDKTVMPVLQVPDFDVLADAEYIGSIDGLEVILPEDAEGVDWQKTVSETVEEYIKIHGGE